MCIRDSCDQTSGSPLHLCEVAEHLSEHEAEVDRFSYKDLIQKRIQKLEEIDIRILAYLSCSEFPIHRAFFDPLIGDKIDARIEKLQSARLLVYHVVHQTLELHHAQIGEAMAATLTQPDKKKLHAQLAQCFDGDSRSRLEQQIEQFELAEELEVASDLMYVAAEKSIGVLAYSCLLYTSDAADE